MSKQGNYNNPLQATIRGILDLYGKKNGALVLPENLDMKGRTVLITGASSGLGFATATRMAAAGAEVIMAVRSGIPEKGEQIKASTGNNNISMLKVDLSDFVSIDQMIDKLEQQYKEVDLLISNAAMVPLKSRLTPQGLEEMFMVNYLSAFYLVNKIMEKGILKSNPEKTARIIFVSSESHRNPEKFDWENFGKYLPYGIKESVAKYGYYKLLLTTFANELSRRLAHKINNPQVGVLCPGPVNSNIAREAPSWMQPLLKVVFGLFFKSPEKASDPVLYLSTANNKGNIPIRYMFLMQEKEMDEKATDSANGKKLWTLSEHLLKELGFALSESI